jgi:hypothetical protein
MTDDTNKKDAARERIVNEYIHNCEKFGVPQDIGAATFGAMNGYDAGWQAHADQSAAAWVRISSEADLPLRDKKAYWVTTKKGFVEKWKYYKAQYKTWLDEALAWMPDDPPPPYQDQNDAALRDGEEGK